MRWSLAHGGAQAWVFSQIYDLDAMVFVMYVCMDVHV